MNEFPAHLCMTLKHNGHKAIYQTVAEYIANDLNYGEWVSDEERDRAIATNELWELHWYPDNPVSFFCIRASTLAALLADAAKC